MVTSYSQSVQNSAKCPHGFPAGTCPICSGMGGGSKASKDRDKPRVAGEMSYNECLAEWHKIQAKKEAKAQEKLDKLQNSKEISFQQRMLQGFDKVQRTFDKISQNISKLPPILGAPVRFVMNFMVKPVINFIFKAVPDAIKNIQTFFNNTINFINSVTEKLAMVFGEIKNFSDSMFLNKAKKSLKTLLSFLTEESAEEESEEAQKIKSREIRNILKSLFRVKKYPKKVEDVENKLAEHI